MGRVEFVVDQLGDVRVVGDVSVAGLVGGTDVLQEHVLDARLVKVGIRVWHDDMVMGAGDDGVLDSRLGDGSVVEGLVEG